MRERKRGRRSPWLLLDRWPGSRRLRERSPNGVWTSRRRLKGRRRSCWRRRRLAQGKRTPTVSPSVVPHLSWRAHPRDYYRAFTLHWITTERKESFWGRVFCHCEPSRAQVIYPSLVVCIVWVRGLQIPYLVWSIPSIWDWRGQFLKSKLCGFCPRCYLWCWWCWEWLWPYGSSTISPLSMSERVPRPPQSLPWRAWPKLCPHPGPLL